MISVLIQQVSWSSQGVAADTPYSTNITWVTGKIFLYNPKFKFGLYDSSEIAINCIHNKLVNLVEMD